MEKNKVKNVGCDECCEGPQAINGEMWRYSESTEKGDAALSMMKSVETVQNSQLCSR